MRAGRTASSNRTIDTRDDAPDTIVWGAFWFTETTPRAKCLGSLWRTKEDAERWLLTLDDEARRDAYVEAWRVQ